MTLTAPIESVVVLSRAIDQTGDVMSLVHEDQLTLPTPCADWDVARLLSHLVAMPRNFVEMADGIEVDWMAEPEPVTVGWTADFRSLADDLIHFWHRSARTPTPSRWTGRPPSSPYTPGTWRGPSATPPTWTRKWPSAAWRSCRRR
jgi:hypothetical protein